MRSKMDKHLLISLVLIKDTIEMGISYWILSIPLNLLEIRPRAIGWVLMVVATHLLAPKIFKRMPIVQRPGIRGEIKLQLAKAIVIFLACLAISLIAVLIKTV